MSGMRTNRRRLNKKKRLIKKKIRFLVIMGIIGVVIPAINLINGDYIKGKFIISIIPIVLFILLLAITLLDKEDAS